MRTNSIFITFFFLIRSCLLADATENFTIKCVSPDSIAIPNAQVSISDNSPGCADNAESLTTGENGECSFSDINNGKYNLTAKHDFFEDYNDIVSVCADSTLTIIMQPLARMLEEVEVEAAWLRSYGTYDEMTLSKQNKEFGVSAIDAISSLPLFQKTIGGTSIKNLNGDVITVVINGRPAKTEELLNINGDEIRKVRYYQIAPMKYRTYTDGPLIEVFIKESQQNEYSAGIFAQTYTLDYSALIIPYFQFRNNNHTFSINPSFNNYRLKPRATETFQMGNVFNTVKNISGSTFYHFNSIQASYQLNKNRHLLYVNIIPEIKTIPSDLESQITSQINGNNVSGSRTVCNSSNNKSIYAQIYYNYHIKNDVELTIEATNYLSNYKKLNSISQDTEGNGYAIENYMTDNNSNTTNTSAFASLSFPLFKGTFSTLANIKLLKTSFDYVLNDNQNIITDESYSNRVSQFYAVSWKRFFGKFGTDIQLICPVLHYRMADGNKYNITSVTPKLRLFYNPSQRWSITGIFNTFVDSKNPEDLNNNISYINPNYIIRNSPEQASLYSYFGKIEASFSTPDRKLYAQTNIRYFGGKNGWETDYSRDGDYAVQHIVKTRYNSYLGYNMTANWNPINWLGITVIYNFLYNNTIYPDHHYTKINNFGGITLSFNYKNFSAYTTVITPFDRGQGYEEIAQNWQFLLGASYRYQNLSLGLQYTGFPDPFRVTTIKTPDFYYSTTDKFTYRHQQLCITVSYNFRSGQSKNRKSIEYHNLDTSTGAKDTGL